MWLFASVVRIGYVSERYRRWRNVLNTGIELFIDIKSKRKNWQLEEIKHEMKRLSELVARKEIYSKQIK